MSSEVLSELRILSSADFDATSLLTVILSGWPTDTFFWIEKDGRP
jgi:hypothetical protein